jgi:hypothetical protein
MERQFDREEGKATPQPDLLSELPTTKPAAKRARKGG